MDANLLANVEHEDFQIEKIDGYDNGLKKEMIFIYQHFVRISKCSKNIN